MEIRAFYDEATGTFTYLLADAAGKKAAVIDPVMSYDPVSGRTGYGPAEPVLEAAQREGWQIDWVLETHAHADHLTAADWVRQRTGARVAIGAGIRAVADRFARLYNIEVAVADGFDRLLEADEQIEVGSLRLRVMPTPGHTEDSVTYLVQDAAFVGDALFQPDYGTPRCDFPGGSASRLYDSIQRLHALPEETRIHVGHDYPPAGRGPRCQTTVGESRRTNVHLKADTTREDFVSLRESRDAGLGLPRLLLPALQVNIRAGRLPEPESNGIVYLKIPLNAVGR